MSYHKTKMAEINKIIRELWKNTYRGNGRQTTVMSLIWLEVKSHVTYLVRSKVTRKRS